jgi:hypothetical protein
MLTYQWQESTDYGITWFDVTSTGSFTGSQSRSLIVNSVSDEYDGNLYRCVVSNSYGGVVSNEAELRINGHMRVLRELTIMDNSALVKITRAQIISLRCQTIIGAISPVEASSL